MFAVTAVLGLLLTIGWRTRVVSVLFFVASLTIHHRNIVTNSGADALMMLITFYVMLAPCGAAYSLDARRAARRRGTDAEPLIVPWAQRLIQLQICLVYFNTAVLKCNGATWLNGTALHYVLYNDEVGRFHLGMLRDYPVLVNLMTHGAILIEFCLAFLLWFRATRVWTIFAGLALHIAILATVNIPIFGELITACYLTFLTPEELDTLLGTLAPRTWPSRLMRRTRSPWDASMSRRDSAALIGSLPSARRLPSRVERLPHSRIHESVKGAAESLHRHPDAPHRKKPLVRCVGFCR